MTFISNLTVAIFILAILFLKFVSYNSNKRTFYAVMNAQDSNNNNKQIDFRLLSTLLCKSTLTLFTHMFLLYLFIHVTGFYIIDTLRISDNADAYLYEILNNLFVITTVISVSVLVAQLLVLLFYERFHIENDLIRHFRNWELMTVLVSLMLLLLLQNTKLTVNLNPSSNTGTYAYKMVFGIFVFYFVFESMGRVLNVDKNILFDTQLTHPTRNKIHFALQLLILLYIIWNI